jgi:hypothetical protein
MAKQITFTPFPKRLQRAVQSWKKYTEPMRQCRQKMLAQYANGWYQGSGGRNHSPVPLNLLDRGVQILGPFLVSHNPRVGIRARKHINNPNVKPFAKTLELALAHLFSEIKLSDYTLRPAAIDSLFGMGITKTGTMHSHQVEIGGYLHDVGQPYCDKIDFDDYIGDVAARNRQEMKFEGHFYRLPFKYVKESGLFKNTDSLKPDLQLYNNDTRPEAIAKSEVQGWEYNELHPTVELIDLWIPEENVILTIPPEGHGGRILRTVEYEGPEDGPFDVLAYRYFPNSIIPIPPVYTWLDLHKIVNVIANKMKSQTEREKTLGIYQLGSDDDAEQVQKGRHGDLVGLNNPDSVKEVTFGGFNQQSFPFLQFMLSQYSQSGPNVDVIGGKGQMANTLGQEQMMQTNALREVDDMVGQMYNFTSSISRKLAWHLWSDPLIIIPVIKRIAGVDLQVEYSEASREGDFFDYSFEVEPYSMARMNPEMRYQRLLQLVSQVVLPLVPIAQAQGATLDVTALLREAAPYLGINNVDEWWRTLVPEAVQNGPYQPIQGEIAKGPSRPQKAKSGQGRDQFGASESSKLSNQSQQQTRAGGQSSKRGTS